MLQTYPPRHRKTHSYLTVVVLLLIVITWAWTRNRTGLFVGRHDAVNIHRAAAAENLQRYGLVRLRFAQVWDPYGTTADPTPYQHHPPGNAYLAYIAVTLLGNSEFAVRISAAGATLIAAACLYKLASKVYGQETALLALFFFGFMPAMIYYSGVIVTLQLGIPAMLATLLLYVEYLERPRSLVLLALSVSAFLGAYVSWMYYLFIAALGLYTLVFLGRKKALALWPFWAGMIGGGLSLLALFLWQSPSFFRELWEDAFLVRATNSIDYPVNQPVSIIAARFLWMPTPVVSIFGVVGISRYFTSWKSMPHRERVLLLPVIITLIFDAVFWQGTYIHDYYLNPALAIFPIWAAVGFWRVFHFRKGAAQGGWAVLMSIFLLLFVVGSWRWSKTLFVDNRFDPLGDWAMRAREATESDETVVVNFSAGSAVTAIRYYARRQIATRQLPADVLSDSRPSEWGFYIYCREEEDPEAIVEELLSRWPYEESDRECYLIDLQP